MNSVGVRLKELRGRSSQAEMAEGIGVKQQNWARWESGVVTPSVDMIIEICRVHACSADWLLGLPVRGGSAGDGADDGAAAARAAALADRKIAGLKRAIIDVLKDY